MRTESQRLFSEKLLLFVYCRGHKWLIEEVYMQRMPWFSISQQHFLRWYCSNSFTFTNAGAFYTVEYFDETSLTRTAMIAFGGWWLFWRNICGSTFRTHLYKHKDKRAKKYAAFRSKVIRQSSKTPLEMEFPFSGAFVQFLSIFNSVICNWLCTNSLIELHQSAMEMMRRYFFLP